MLEIGEGLSGHVRFFFFFPLPLLFSFFNFI